MVTGQWWRRDSMSSLTFEWRHRRPRDENDRLASCAMAQTSRYWLWAVVSGQHRTAMTSTALTWSVINSTTPSSLTVANMGQQRSPVIWISRKGTEDSSRERPRNRRIDVIHLDGEECGERARERDVPQWSNDILGLVIVPKILHCR